MTLAALRDPSRKPMLPPQVQVHLAIFFHRHLGKTYHYPIRCVRFQSNVNPTERIQFKSAMVGHSRNMAAICTSGFRTRQFLHPPKSCDLEKAWSLFHGGGHGEYVS